MVSYPFFSDQPALARRCREFGLSLPLTHSVRGPVEREDVHVALAEVAREADAFATRLEEARGWELETIAARGAVVQQITEFIAARSARPRP
jgi:uncharacterized membrane protein